MIFILPEGFALYCRLLTVGADRHVTACLAEISADHPVLLTCEQPAELCSGCRRDLEVRRQRCNTVDLRPSVRVLGVRADVGVGR